MASATVTAGDCATGAADTGTSEECSEPGPASARQYASGLIRSVRRARDPYSDHKSTNEFLLLIAQMITARVIADSWEERDHMTPEHLDTFDPSEPPERVWVTLETAEKNDRDLIGKVLLKAMWPIAEVNKSRIGDGSGDGGDARAMVWRRGEHIKRNVECKTARMNGTSYVVNWSITQETRCAYFVCVVDRDMPRRVLLRDLPSRIVAIVVFDSEELVGNNQRYPLRHQFTFSPNKCHTRGDPSTFKMISKGRGHTKILKSLRCRAVVKKPADWKTLRSFRWTP